MDQIKELETAILARANRLANEYLEHAKRSRDEILRNAGEKMHLREDREVLLAKARAERSYRRMVQANELKLHREMDHLRWNLVEGVSERLSEKMTAFMEDRLQYRNLLMTLVNQAAASIERNELIAEVNARDLDWLEPQWEELSQRIIGTKTVSLSTVPIDALGGIRIRSGDNRIRLDHTFEGRIQRLQSEIHQIIIERLLPNNNRVLKS
jgi:V/A-type H+-transporting ATPase subunit E